MCSYSNAKTSQEIRIGMVGSPEPDIIIFLFRLNTVYFIIWSVFINICNRIRQCTTDWKQNLLICIKVKMLPCLFLLQSFMTKICSLKWADLHILLLLYSESQQSCWFTIMYVKLIHCSCFQNRLTHIYQTSRSLKI